MDSEGLGGAWGPHITSEELETGSRHKVIEPTKRKHWDNLVVMSCEVSESSRIQPQGMGACSLNHPEGEEKAVD